MEILSNYKHVAFCPSVGLGHLKPLLRLASMVASLNVKVTLVIIKPTLSSAETNLINTFLSTHPHITSSDFHALPCDPDLPYNDPFLLQYDAVSRSSHLLANHVLAFSPRPSAVFSDLMLASGLHEPLSELGIDSFTLFITCAKFFCLMLSRLNMSFTEGVDVELPGLSSCIPIDDIPPFLCNQNHIMGRIAEINCRHLPKAKGVILNTFDFMEPEALSALRSGKILADLPPVFPVGPLHTLKSEKGSSCKSWLDKQASKSVVFVCFGNRTSVSKEQIKEIGDGLQRSGVKFMWVIKTRAVDEDDTEELKDLLGEDFLEKTRNQGFIVKQIVDQDEILAHRATGGFVTHCGWNSIIEAVQRGVPLLGWPLPFGDQRISAGQMKAAGAGMWEKSWVGERLVKSDEIAVKIKELMTSESVRASANKVWEAATKAWTSEGSSRQAFNKVALGKMTS